MAVSDTGFRLSAIDCADVSLMETHNRLFQQFPRIAAAGILTIVVAACAIELRDRSEVQGPSAVETARAAETLAPKLEACRAVTSEQTEAFESCREIWAENRQRFFAPQKHSSGALKGSQQPTGSETSSLKGKTLPPQTTPITVKPAKE